MQAAIPPIDTPILAEITDDMRAIFEDKRIIKRLGAGGHRGDDDLPVQRAA